MSPPRNLRRSARIKPTVKYTDDSNLERRSTSPNVLKFEIEKQLDDIKEDVQKPFELFSEKDVSGRKLYGFQTPVKKNSMMLKANQTHVSETPISLKTLPRLKIVLDKIVMTPNDGNTDSCNKKVTKEIQKRFPPKINLSSDESVSEDSEYVPTNDEDSSESDEMSDESNESETSDTSEERNIRTRMMQNVTQKCSPKLIVQKTPKKMEKRRKAVNYRDCHIKTDEYFESQSEKTITSDRTLGRLQNARLTEDKLEELLVNQSHVSSVHKKRVCTLTENCKSFFPMWYFIMEEGYSLLLHGLGSKRNLINDFHNEVIKDHPSLVINGFFPSLSIKDILNGIIVDILDLDCPTNPNDCLELIKKVLSANPDDRLYLMIHNIDGIMLRSNKTQLVLASLAAIPNIRLLASVDHINAPLLWDHVKRAKFNFYWWDATTFLPYQAETSYESSLMVQQNGVLALSSLQNVFLSLTSNARTIYLILIKYKLNKNVEARNFTGMPFKDLYRAAREQFLVSSDLALRAQLTEFIDHKLVRIKRNVDGAEYLVIPLDKSLLKQFVEQYGS